MHPDQEILELEKRLVRRRRELDLIAHETAHCAMKKLASPAVLIGAAALGFVVGGGLPRRRAKVGKKKDEDAPVKKTGIAGLIMTGAMWLIRARFGSPVVAAQYLLEKIRHGRHATPPSPFDDSGEAEAGGRRRYSRPAQIYR